MNTTQYLMLILGLGVTSAASAQPFYALIEGGVAQGQLSTSAFDASAAQWKTHPEATSGRVSDNTSSSSVFRLGAGYQFADRFALEAGYESLGSYDASMTLDGHNATGDTASTRVKEQVSVKGLGVRLVGNYPMSQKISLLGSLGLSYLTHERDNSVSIKNYADTSAKTGNTSESVNQLSPSIGLGVSVDVSKEVSLRGWYGRYLNAASTDSLSDFHIDTLSAGLVIRW